MSSYSTPLLMPQGAPALLGGVEVFLTEVKNVSPGGVGEKDRLFTGMNVLVSLCGDSADRCALWTLRSALAFGQSLHWTGMDWPDWLSECVSFSQPSFATVVVYVGAATLPLTKTVQAAIDAIRKAFEPLEINIVVVCANSNRFAKLHGASGFVQGMLTTTGDTARQVFLALSVFLAHSDLSGIDWVDMEPVLGTANAPTILAEAIWIRQEGRDLHFLDALGRAVVRSAERVVAIPFLHDMRVKELSSIQAALRAEVNEDARPIVLAAHNALALDSLPTGIGWVPLLCR